MSASATPPSPVISAATAAAGPVVGACPVHGAAEIVDHDRRTARREKPGVGAADAPSRARDDRDPAVEAILLGVVAQAATGALNPSSPPRVPPTMASRSSTGTTGELLGHELPAAAERPLRVRVVVAPHDRREAGDVPAGDGHRVVLERDVELAPDVLARHQRIGPLLVEPEELRDARLLVRRPAVVPDAEPPVGVLPDSRHPAFVHCTHQRRQPVRIELDQREVQIRIALRQHRHRRARR